MPRNQGGCLQTGALHSIKGQRQPDRKVDLKLALEIADEFIGLLKDTSFRAEAKKIEEPQRIPTGSRFELVRNRARELQGALERLFFESAVLKDRSIRYLSF